MSLKQLHFFSSTNFSSQGIRIPIQPKKLIHQQDEILLGVCEARIVGLEAGKPLKKPANPPRLKCRPYNKKNPNASINSKDTSNN